jgi:hypothetical protein
LGFGTPYTDLAEDGEWEMKKKKNKKRRTEERDDIHYEAAMWLRRRG